MLLSLLGLTTTRNNVLALFDLKRSNPDYPGASHLEIGNVFAGAAKVSNWRWEYYERFRLVAISRSLRAQLRSRGRPTLLSFGAIHKNGEWRTSHVAVAISATKETLQLLDPLGKRPGVHDAANVWLQAGGHPDSIHVIGNSYSVDRAAEAAVFRWTG